MSRKKKVNEIVPLTEFQVLRKQYDELVQLTPVSRAEHQALLERVNALEGMLEGVRYNVLDEIREIADDKVNEHRREYSHEHHRDW
jgi:hypothetical protein